MMANWCLGISPAGRFSPSLVLAVAHFIHSLPATLSIQVFLQLGMGIRLSASTSPRAEKEPDKVSGMNAIKLRVLCARTYTMGQGGRYCTKPENVLYKPGSNLAETCTPVRLTPLT